MKTTHKILLCLIGIVFFSCNGNFNIGTQGSGNITKEKRAIATSFDKTVRGVKVVLTRRGLSCADYTPKAADA